MKSVRRLSALCMSIFLALSGIGSGILPAAASDTSDAGLDMYATRSISEKQYEKICESLPDTGDLTSVSLPAESEKGTSDSGLVESSSDGVSTDESSAGTDSDSTATINTGSADVSLDTSLPSSYSLVAQNDVTSVKDQGSYGSCWTFATMASLESNLLMNKNLTYDLSELQLAYFTYHNPATVLSGLEGDATTVKSSDGFLNVGGNPLTAQYKLMASTGAVDESLADYDTASSSMTLPDADAYSSNEAEVTSTYEAPLSSITAVKNLITSKGGVAVGMMWDGGAYNKNTYSYYLDETGCEAAENDTSAGGHAVTIVGWDDNYSKSNFSSSVNAQAQPSSNGAWLIKNSWGTGNGWDNDGYFWISYYDYYLYYSGYGRGIAFEGEPASDAEDYIYQYDGGTNYSWLYFVDDYGNPITSGYMANVFTASSNETLKAVAVDTYEMGDTYTVSIYKNPTSSSNPKSGTLVSASTTGTFTYGGYQKITLNTPVTLSKGTTFSVVVKLKTSNSYSPCLMIDSTDTSDSSISYISATKTGQSFVSDDGSSWMDIDNDTSDDITANARIKAFADEIVDVSNSSIIIADNATYTGKNICPEITYKGETLKEGTDYTFTVGSNGNDTVPGTASVIITGIGDYTGSIEKTFTIQKAEQTLSGTDAYSKYVTDGSFYLDAAVPSDGGTLSYSSDNESVASVDADTGEVTLHKAGTANITVTAAENTYYHAASKEITVTVSKTQQSLSGTQSYSKTYGDADFLLDAKNSVAVSSGGSNLTFSSDNTSVAVVDENSGLVSLKDAGTANITVAAAETDDCEAASMTVQITVSKSSQVLSGTAAYKVVYGTSDFYPDIVNGSEDGGALSYTSSNNAVVSLDASTGLIHLAGTGKATVTVTAAATDRYNAASTSFTVTVLPKTMVLSSLDSYVKGSLDLAWKKDSMATGYQIRYSKSKSMAGSAVKTVTNSATVSKVLYGLPSGTRYYVQVRAYKYMDGSTYYGGWSTVKYKTTKAVTVKKTSLSKLVRLSESAIKTFWIKVTGADGYQIRYGWKKSMPAKKTITVSGNSSLKKTISGLDGSKRYYFKVRAYKKLYGKTYYGSWSSIKSKTTG